MTESDEVILKVENLSKQYRLGLVGTGTLSHDLNRWWHRVRGKEDPYLKIGETNDRSQKGESEYVWALKDINFEVKRGEVLGIIGKNGAGKSTLLKILSKVTSPTSGSVKSRGRIASLLEVGTGFHGEMTGRENIYLNGAILGMTKKEIASKIDEIIDFSGCARYIDTPVKRYSSGMTVRLAFAVAAFLEPDILIVDEVLAVGDAEFQKKAIGKMRDISSGGGRTVLFVSHNLYSVEILCEKIIILENGKIKNISKSVKKTLASYKENLLSDKKKNNSRQKKVPSNSDSIQLDSIKTCDLFGNEKFNFDQDEDIFIELKYRTMSKLKKYTHGINIYNTEKVLVLSSHDFDFYEYSDRQELPESTRRFIIPGNVLNEGIYFVEFVFMSYNPFTVILKLSDILGFSINRNLQNSFRHLYNKQIPGIVSIPVKWQ